MIGKLIKNELIKIFRQTGWKIITLIILIVAIVVPPFMKSLIPGKTDVYIDHYYYYKQEYEKTEPDSAEREYLKALLEAEKFCMDNNIDVNGWRYGYVHAYKKDYVTLRALELIRDGWDALEIADAFKEYSDMAVYTDENGKDQLYINTLTNSDYNTGSFEYESVPFDKNDISDYIAAESEIIRKTEKLLLSGKTEYADIKIKEIREMLKAEEAILADAKTKFIEDNPQRFEYDTARNRCEILKITGQCWESFKKCEKENENWIHSEICYYMDDLLNNAYYNSALNKSSFKDGKYIVQFGGNPSLSFNSYEKYLERYADPKREDYILGAKTVLYSVENRIPIGPDYNNSGISSKKWLEYSINIDVYIVMFFCIFLACVIMSSEYGSGTIRLLVIRPCARWKLLLSKLLVIGIFGVGMLMAAFLITFASTVISFGWGDLGVPCLETSGESIIQTAPLICTLKNALINSLSMFCIAALAFFLSLFIKKGVFSIAVSILLYAFGGAIANVSWYALEALPFLRYTLIPYFMNLGVIRYNALDRAISISPVSADYGLDIQSGIIITLMTSVILTVMSFVIFDRQQIKN